MPSHSLSFPLQSCDPVYPCMFHERGLLSVILLLPVFCAVQALGAYMFFCKENRETLKQENPEVSFGELGKLLGSKWSGMSENEKKVGAEMWRPPASILAGSLRPRLLFFVAGTHHTPYSDEVLALRDAFPLWEQRSACHARSRERETVGSRQRLQASY